MSKKKSPTALHRRRWHVWRSLNAIVLCGGLQYVRVLCAVLLEPQQDGGGHRQLGGSNDTTKDPAPKGAREPMDLLQEEIPPLPWRMSKTMAFTFDPVWLDWFLVGSLALTLLLTAHGGVKKTTKLTMRLAMSFSFLAIMQMAFMWMLPRIVDTHCEADGLEGNVFMDSLLVLVGELRICTLGFPSMRTYAITALAIQWHQTGPSPSGSWVEKGGLDMLVPIIWVQAYIVPTLTILLGVGLLLVTRSNLSLNLVFGVFFAAVFAYGWGVIRKYKQSRARAWAARFCPFCGGRSEPGDAETRLGAPGGSKWAKKKPKHGFDCLALCYCVVIGFEVGLKEEDDEILSTVSRATSSGSSAYGSFSGGGAPGAKRKKKKKKLTKVEQLEQQEEQIAHLTSDLQRTTQQLDGESHERRLKEKQLLTVTTDSQAQKKEQQDRIYELTKYVQMYRAMAPDLPIATKEPPGISASDTATEQQVGGGQTKTGAGSVFDIFSRQVWFNDSSAREANRRKASLHITQSPESDGGTTSGDISNIYVGAPPVRRDQDGVEVVPINMASHDAVAGTRSYVELSAVAQHSRRPHEQFVVLTPEKLAKETQQTERESKDAARGRRRGGGGGGSSTYTFGPSAASDIPRLFRSC